MPSTKLAVPAVRCLNEQYPVIEATRLEVFTVLQAICAFVFSGGKREIYLRAQVRETQTEKEGKGMFY